jgi:glycosyltransferase involved in cell wall biosynthesis
MWIIAWYRIDVVHPQGIDDFVFATSAARLLNKRAIWTDHGDAKHFMRPVSSPRLRALALRAAKYANAVVVVSKSEKEEILSVAPDFPNIVVVHNGVFVRKQTVRKKPNAAPLVIGCTSRLIKTKGIGELLRAFSCLKQAEKLELWLVGAGDDEEEFKKHARRLGIQGRVKFLGFQEDVWRYLEAFDIYVHPSYHEAFSIALIEAAMTGKPTVATRVGGNPEIVNEKTGILVEPKDVDSLKEGLQKLIDDPALRKSLGDAARKLAVEKYDFGKIVEEKMAPLYE